MGKKVFIFVLSQMVANMWWYCATQQESVTETPLIVMPILLTLLFLFFIGRWVLLNWDLKL